MSTLVEIQHMETTVVENMEATNDKDIERMNYEERNTKKHTGSKILLILNAFALAVGIMLIWKLIDKFQPLD